MSDCCEVPETLGGDRTACPRCEQRGKKVPLTAVQANATADALRAGIPTAPRFCETLECPVVYFDSESERVIEQALVTIPTLAKNTEDDSVLACHCFGYSRAAIRRAIELSPDSPVSKEIAAEVQAGHCACEVRNPKGTCCLGDVIAIERASLAARSLEHEEEIDANQAPACHC